MTEDGLKLAVSHGWRRAPNRNRHLVFKCDLGSVQWYPHGSVAVFTRGNSNLGIAKSLFCKAFSWLSNSELGSLCAGSASEVGRHWEIDVGKPVPRGISIDQFQKSHGLRIHTDKSHDLNIVEVEETVPLYLQEMVTLQRLFDQNIREHLALIEAWQKEAKARARVSRDRKPRKRKKKFSGVTIVTGWLKKVGLRKHG